MKLIEQIEALITPSAQALGYDIVQVRFNEAAKRRTLQIMAERSSDKLMTLEDCEKLSRTISALLDVEDNIQGRYSLEVGSPGIDRPLTRPSDFETYKGFDAKIDMNLPVEGRKRFTGHLVGRSDNGSGEEAVLLVDGREWLLPIAAIQSAKLVLTDALIKASQAQMKINEEASQAPDVKTQTN
ncbi:MAG: ribosome maturation factor RimP [Alphaproteobacteria bacterium]|nr:ribosome maturation factor RimP [Alphaproteobacteria bacterium]